MDRESFSSCPKLLSICIPSSVETLGHMAFAECRSLSTVTFESGSKLTTVDGREVFQGCYSLASLFIPSVLCELFRDYHGDGFDIVVREEAAEGSQ
jgi:hypothetical protein